MSKITRVTQKQFGLNGLATYFGQFGSLASGTPVTTKDPKEIQNTTAFLTGWTAETVATNRPALEDFNGLDFLKFYQLGYILQQGVPEWDSATTYYIGSIVNDTANTAGLGVGVLLKSKIDDNLNNVLSNSTAWGAAVSVPSVSGGVAGSFKNLSIVQTSATQVTVTLDEIVLEDSSNNKVTVRALNQVAAITSSGANGLDTGSEASSTWYYIHVIAKADGTKGVLLSASATSPTLPSGYIYKAVVGAVRNDGSSNFIPFWQNGRTYFFDSYPVLLSGGSSSTWATVDLSSMVPTGIATAAKIMCSIGGSHTGQLWLRRYGATYDPSGTGSYKQEWGLDSSNNSTSNNGGEATGEIMTDDSGRIEYKSGTDGNAHSISVYGFTINKLG